MTSVASVFITSTILFLLLAIVVVMFVIFYQKKLLQQKFDLQQMEHDREVALMQATIDAQEKEQSRIGKDLHDDLGALLTASKIQIGQIERFTEKDSKAFTFVQLSGEMVDESIDRLGAIARSLVPPTLERFGIKDALKEYTGQFSYSDQPKFDISVVNRRFDTPVELGLFRMIQELVNNTLKYAQANHITISITENQNWLKLEYSDNGIGFDIESAQRGLGLRNLEGRSHILGGSCQLESTMGNGMRATIRIRNKKQGEI